MDVIRAPIPEGCSRKAEAEMLKETWPRAWLAQGGEEGHTGDNLLRTLFHVATFFFHM